MGENTEARLAAILKDVISTEISLRVGDLNIVEQNINTVRQYLNRTRQAVCAEFYEDNFKTVLQKPPHRAVKNTFMGKTPAKEEADPPVQSGEDNYSWADVPSTSGMNQSSTINKVPVDSGYGDVKRENFDREGETSLKYFDPEDKRLACGVDEKGPRYVPPVIPVHQIQRGLKPRGTKQTKKIRFLVRNNSKYIVDPEDSSGATHKWSLSVKLNDESIDISQIVSKVVFHLHPSYRPNDIVTVHSAPFKITRRGWGEFDLRVKIFFSNEKDEPLDITHPLVFDKLKTGLETFGGETIFDHWIIDPSELESQRVCSTVASSVLPIPKQGTPVKMDNQLIKTEITQTTKPPSPTTAIPSTSFGNINTLPFNNETSSSFLSAFFGDFEEQTSAKREWSGDWGVSDNLFNVDDLAFPEFFNFGGSESKAESVSKVGDNKAQIVSPVSIQVKKEDADSNSNIGESEIVSDLNEKKAVSNESESFQTSVTDVVSVPYESSVANERIGPIDDQQTPEFSGTNSTQNVNETPVTVVGFDETTSLKPCRDLQQGIQTELFLSDLSEFGEEVIIADCSEDIVEEIVETMPSKEIVSTYEPIKVEPVSATLEMKPIKMEPAGATVEMDPIKIEPVSATVEMKPIKMEPVGVDYTTIEMDDLIKFPTNQPIVPSLSGTSSLYVVTPSTSSMAVNKREFQGSKQGAITSLMPNTRPTSTVLVSSGNMSSTLPQSNIQSQIVHSLKPIVKESIPRRSISRKTVPQRSPTILQSRGVAKAEPCGTRLSLPSSSSTLRSAAALPVRATGSPSNPVVVKAGQQPITLVSILNSSSPNMSVSKTAPIVISSKIGSQTVPNVIVSSSQALPKVAAKTIRTVKNIVVSQGNTPIPVQGVPVMVKSNASKVTNNVIRISPKNVCIRPGSTQFMVKMPDGTLKPINLETLTPVKPSDLKTMRPLTSASQPILRTNQQSGVRSVVPTAMMSFPVQPTNMKGAAIGVKRKSQTLLVPAATTKKRKLETMCAASGSNFKPTILPRMPSTVKVSPVQQIQILPRPNQQLIRLPNSSQGKIRLAPLRSLVKNGPSQITSTQSEPPQQCSSPRILKTKPQDFLFCSSLVEQCPRYSLELAVHWLLTKFPLIDDRTKSDSFKANFPYCASSLQTFRQWPLTKCRAHEMMRATDVFRIVKKVFPQCEWSKLDIIMFARRRGFTPLFGRPNASFVTGKPSSVPTVLTEVTDLLSSLLESCCTPSDEEVDVCSILDETVVQPETSSDTEKADLPSVRTFMTLGSHVKDATMIEKWVEQVSIYLDPEEIEPGIVYPAALRLLVSVYHSFAEDLIRRTYNCGYLRYGSNVPSLLAPEDVQVALLSRKEFDLFTLEGLGTTMKKSSAPLSSINSLPGKSGC